MRHTGFIRNGRVECDEPMSLPDGTRVEIAKASKTKSAQTTSRKAKTKKPKTSPRAKAAKTTLLDRLRPIVGTAKGLPKDFAAQHDHYIHGAPRR